MPAQPRTWIGFIVALFVLVGCAPLPNNEDSIVVPTVAPPLVVQRSPTALATAIPSLTAQPTLAPTPTRPSTVTAQPTSTPQPTATETLVVIAATAEPTIIVEPEQYVREELLSPDGQWMATTTYTRVVSDFPTEVTFTLIHQQSNEVRVIEEILEWEGNWWIEEVPVPVAWSVDSQTLYYGYSPGYLDGCMPSPHSTLHQYTLANNTREILDTPAGSWHEFSPDTQQVAYFPIRPADAPPALALYTPTTDTLQEIPFPEFDPSLAFIQDVMGQILWHPNGKTIVLSVSFGPCGGEIPALLLVDTTTLEMTVMEVSDSWQALEGWEGNVVVIRDRDGTVRKYDIETGAWVGE